MKNLLSKISNWMFRRWGTLDEKVLVRDWLKLEHSKIDLEAMSPTQRQIVLVSAKQLYENKFFHMLLSHLTAETKDVTIYEAETKNQLLAARINVFLLESLEEQSRYYMAEWRAYNNEEEELEGIESPVTAY